jgi:hypothetical protein
MVTREQISHETVLGYRFLACFAFFKVLECLSCTVDLSLSLCLTLTNSHKLFPEVQMLDVQGVGLGRGHSLEFIGDTLFIRPVLDLLKELLGLFCFFKVIGGKEGAVWLFIRRFLKTQVVQNETTGCLCVASLLPFQDFYYRLVYQF